MLNEGIDLGFEGSQFAAIQSQGAGCADQLGFKLLAFGFQFSGHATLATAMNRPAIRARVMAKPNIS